MLFIQFQDEIFGPVLAVTKFKTEEEAVQLANDTTYGLGAGLHSSMSRALICALLVPEFRIYGRTRSSWIPSEIAFV